MEDSVEYDVKAILGVSFENGLRSYRVQWSDLTEGWEPDEALVNVCQYCLILRHVTLIFRFQICILVVSVTIVES